MEIAFFTASVMFAVWMGYIAFFGSSVFARRFAAVTVGLHIFTACALVNSFLQIKPQTANLSATCSIADESERLFYDKERDTLYYCTNGNEWQALSDCVLYKGDKAIFCTGTELDKELSKWRTLEPNSLPVKTDKPVQYIGSHFYDPPTCTTENGLYYNQQFGEYRYCIADK